MSQHKNPQTIPFYLSPGQIEGSVEHQSNGDGGAAAEPQPAGGGGSDAPPTNRASHGYGEGKGKGEEEEGETRILRVGIDALVLSFPGDIDHSVDSELSMLKYDAQSRHPEDRINAQKEICGHVFEVSDKGQKPFAYILEDKSYRICVKSGQSGMAPLAYVKASSELLAHRLPEEIVAEVAAIVQELGECSLPVVSRIDLYADFVTKTIFDEIPDSAWVRQASIISRHIEEGRLTGWSFGAGAALSARLYDKTREIQKSKKFFFHDLWKRSGWDGESQVLRIEVQAMRPILGAFKLNSFNEVIENVGGLWQSFTNSWLRLTVPDPSDSNRSRWPMHPVWKVLAAIKWRLDDQPLTRSYSPARVPSDEYIARTAMALTISFMAKYNIRRYEDGVEALQAVARQLTQARCETQLDILFPDWIDQQVGLKARQYNSRRNAKPPKLDASTPIEIDRAAKDYDDKSNGA